VQQTRMLRLQRRQHSWSSCCRPAALSRLPEFEPDPSILIHAPTVANATVVDDTAATASCQLWTSVCLA
jgi:hypothetical protein